MFFPACRLACRTVMPRGNGSHSAGTGVPACCSAGCRGCLFLSMPRCAVLHGPQGATALEQAMKAQRLHVMYADVLLWRDKTRARVATVQQHQRDNVVVCDT